MLFETFKNLVGGGKPRLSVTLYGLTHRSFITRTELKIYFIYRVKDLLYRSIKRFKSTENAFFRSVFVSGCET